MKKKLMIFFVVSILIVTGVFFCYSFSFDSLVRDEDSIFITNIEDKTINGKARLDSKCYTIYSDTQEHIQFKNILKKYTYHRTLKSITGQKGLQRNYDGYTLIIYIGEDGGNTRNSVIINGNGEVLVNSNSYDVGFLSNKKSIAMMEEIKEILNKKQPS